MKELAEDVIRQLPLPGIEGGALDPGDIWPAVTLAAVDRTSIWETCKDNDNAPCDETVMDWLHTINGEWLERIANDLLKEMAMTILDPGRSRVVSIDFVDNPYHGTYSNETGELCRTAAKDGTTTCHRYGSARRKPRALARGGCQCTAYLVSNGKPVSWPI